MSMPPRRASAGRRQLEFEDPVGPLGKHRAFVGRRVDAYVVSATEGGKSVAREVFQHTSQVLHGFSASVLNLIYNKGYYSSNFDRVAHAPESPARRGSVSNTSFLEKALTGDVQLPKSPDVPFEAKDSHGETRKGPGLFRRMALFVFSWVSLVLLWIPVIGMRFARASARAEKKKKTGSSGRGMVRDPSTDRIQAHPWMGEGLLERIQLNVLSFIDRVGRNLRRFTLWVLHLTPRGAHRSSPVGPRPERQPPPQPLPQPSPSGKKGCIVGEVVRRAGYPFETRNVVTEDGHILLLERLPRVGSRKVIFLIHGILDSSHAWVGNGVASGLAFRAYDRGYDVFMGNMRGTRGKLHSDPNISVRDYWAFSLDDHGIHDVAALVSAIRATKNSEIASWAHPSPPASAIPRQSDPGPNRPDPSDSGGLSITAVAHSMGCASVMIYTTTCLQKGRHHHFNKIVLMSPAGYHSEIPKLCKVLGPVIEATLARCVPAFYLPGESVRAWVSQLLHDIAQTPGLRDLYAFLLSKLLGGTTMDHPVVASPGLARNTLTSGTSVRVFKQFWNNYKRRGFYGFDFGPSVNLDMYGSQTPTDYLSLYRLLDVPVHFMAGTLDRLIRVPDIRHQYNVLREHKPALATYKEFKKAGHIDFTYGVDDALCADVFKHCD
mmetsp:Transcript_9518/g.21842  ORF Transcript_9518/g.21842 Transcript_9518/m.21842 type:complete len:661 (+) Transcript_9518:89-2071(+)|eukprot:CAMPEP_0114544060 /NCGR_PEP_ID=MMETSP0114-20121206/2679_1 /TAXON_ID=31324 /ORGANISM="Goniomonas sp, Strain m" /LENGTH=660 /DNA_ID=CAMNT_0001728423 /DNA_START=59 /DNA_END=2041 /DNA_ORIENTATION=+